MRSYRLSEARIHLRKCMLRNMIDALWLSPPGRIKCVCVSARPRPCVCVRVRVCCVSSRHIGAKTGSKTRSTAASMVQPTQDVAKREGKLTSRSEEPFLEVDSQP
jgi:hypothetical protein